MAAKLSGPAGDPRFHIEQNSDINVTPFVDVMLVLLIIFMVAAPLATVSVPIVLPQAVAPPAANPPKPIYVSIQPSGSLYLMNSRTSLATMGDDLRKQIGKRDPEKERIFIRADKDTLYREFMNVMNELQDQGFYSVALVGEDNNRHKKG
jgi:biopolymer transport protein ExbD